MITLDASALIAHLNPNDSHHKTATDLLLSTLSEPLLVHPVTMAEVLVGGARFGRAEQMYADLLAIGIQLSPQDDQEPLRLAHLRVTTRLKLPDCCVLDTAITNRSALATFDHAVADAAMSHGVAVLPNR